MTAQNFMNVVRFKLKSDFVDKYFEVIDKTSFEGMTQRYIAKTGDYDYCFVGIWESAEAIAAQRPVMKGSRVETIEAARKEYAELLKEGWKKTSIFNSYF